jgi:hypothetical protein
MKKLNLLGRRFGKLRVIAQAGTRRVKGKTKCLVAWAAEIGIPLHCITGFEPAGQLSMLSV